MSAFSALSASARVTTDANKLLTTAPIPDAACFYNTSGTDGAWADAITGASTVAVNHATWVSLASIFTSIRTPAAALFDVSSAGVIQVKTTGLYSLDFAVTVSMSIGYSVSVAVDKNATLTPMTGTTVKNSFHASSLQSGQYHCNILVDATANDTFTLIAKVTSTDGGATPQTMYVPSASFSMIFIK